MLTPRDIVFRLKPCSWRYNDVIPALGDKIHYGFIAQDLQRDFGDKYGFVDDHGEFLQVNYLEFIAPMVKIIQEQEQRIQQLEHIVGELHEQLGIRTSNSSGSGNALVCDKRDEELAGQSSES